jgi:CO/xanthine dehydrogenase Mo-binding subunit
LARCCVFEPTAFASRFATGKAVVEASRKIVDELRARAALSWDVDVEGEVWEDGQAKPMRGRSNSSSVGLA